MKNTVSPPEASTQYRLPRLGEPAPQFEAVTTQGAIRLEDYQGRWVILFSHPADFTPVCTTEFIAFAHAQPAFKEMNCELIGLSIDSYFSHIAWIMSIEKNFNTKITFPVIADINRDVAIKYGMIMPDDAVTATSRCVFVIDDKQIVRAMIYYPFTTGRNIDELLRLVKALQTADELGVGTGADWKPGDNLILFPPLTQDEVEERIRSGSPDCKDWFYAEYKP